MCNMTELVFKDPSCKKIAVRLSGGPDSAIVYYAVCNHYKHDDAVKIFPYTMSSPLRPHAMTKSVEIVEFVSRLTNKTPAHHYHLHHENHNKNNSNDVNIYEYTRGQELLETTVVTEQQIDIRYTGLSMNCPADVLEKYRESLPSIRAMKYAGALESRARDRDDIFGQRIEYLYFSENHGYYSFLPLVNTDKRTVKAMYDFYGLTSSLYPITWSCENDLQAESTNPKHCGSCYFCLEREFAFGKL